MKVELELTEAELAQVMWALGEGCALLTEREPDSTNYYVARETLRCLAGLVLQNCEGYDGRGSSVILLRKQSNTGGARL